MKKALLFGASGFVGSHLLQELLNNTDYDQVTIVVRKDLAITHPKLTTLIGDYHSLPELKADLVADDLFIALGTTKRKTPDKAEYYRVDHDYPVLAATIAKENGATAIFIITAVGANADSGITYVKTKGQVEKAIIALDFQHTHIFRPSMILGKRSEKRLMEKSLIKLWNFINPVLPVKYKGMDGKDIAKAMNNAANNQVEKVKIYHWKEMNQLL